MVKNGSGFQEICSRQPAHGSLIVIFEGRYLKRMFAQSRRRVRKGIPQAVRGHVWQVMAGSSQLMQANPGRYEKLLQAPPTESDRQIRLDLTRTFPKQIMFMEKHGQGQQSLFNVLKAYAVTDPKVGYCQGMGFITALFLMFMPEEEAYWLLMQLMNGYGAVGMFAQGLPTVEMLLFILDKLIQKYLPKLHASFEREGIVTSMYASQWIITGFTYDYPMSFVLRVWDVFLAEGFKALFRVALALLKREEPHMLGLSLEKIMGRVKQIPRLINDSNEDELIESALSYGLTTKELDKLEQEYSQQPGARPIDHPPIIKKNILYEPPKRK
eukprot:TRINITY_DN2603_c0_g1_i2.p1 TRINITY_DN2603_c0_g1~~TRINITY_DN2603_c0_g1_i2.p1  ORF type:complete len:327 (+),score=50.39 TRINITY_DN2603_c0_g1_i2:380-1360(+)